MCDLKADRRKGKNKKSKSRSPRKQGRKRKRQGEETVLKKHKKSSNSDKLISPSQTTVYVQALSKKNKKGKQKFTEEQVDAALRNLRLEKLIVPNDVLDSDQSDDARQGQRNPRRRQERDLAEEEIIQAEKFKAEIARPREGKDNDERENAGPLKQPIDSEDDDDDFYEMTCHVDSALKKKIQRGEFIELEKLLPKPLDLKDNKEQTIDIIEREGQSYLVPGKVRDQMKITNVKRWDEAFRVYVSIYSKANPNRSSEIMQYLHTIHSAASTFYWPNVAQYDFVFRKKMGQRRHRNWARTNTQLWSKTMVNPLNKSFNNNSSQGIAGAVSGRKDWRDIACWRYNRNKCSKINCRFEHRCSFCGSFSHIYLGCPKKTKCSEKQTESDKKKDKKQDKRETAETDNN